MLVDPHFLSVVSPWVRPSNPAKDISKPNSIFSSKKKYIVKNGVWLNHFYSIFYIGDACSKLVIGAGYVFEGGELGDRRSILGWWFPAMCFSLFQIILIHARRRKDTSDL